MMKSYWPRVPLQDSPVSSITDRVMALVVVGAAALLVYILAAVVPDGRGYGTHEALGMEPCGWPIQYGIPCPTCGVTTSACLMVHLSPLQSILVQPFGAYLTLVGLWSAAIAGICLVRRRSFVAWIGFLPYGLIVVIGFVLMFLSWGYLWLTWDSV